MGTVVCPRCRGNKRLPGKLKLPCAVCSASGKITDDPWWVNYYNKVFGVKEECEQVTLNLE